MVATLAVAAGLITACSTPTHEVSKTDLQKMAKEKLEAAAKKKAKSVTCDDAIEAKTGQTQHCVLTDSNGTKWNVTATVTAVKDDNTRIDFKVDKTPIK